MSSRNHDDAAQFAPGAVTHAEIFRQPELWLTTFDRFQPAPLPHDQLNRRVIVTGAGTSAYAASAVAASWPGASAAPTTDLLLASREEIECAFPDFVESGLLISLGRSGDSPESGAVVSRIQRMFTSVEHLAIICNSQGRLANWDGISRIVLDPRTNDQSLAMTSSFSNLVLAGLCLRRADQIGRSLQDLCRRAESTLPYLDIEAQRLAELPVERIVVLASGSLKALAAETSLKILEMTAGRVVTLAETFLGLRHGPMSFLRSDSVVLCYLSSSPEHRRYEEDLIKELRHKQLGHIVAVGGHDDTRKGLFDTVVPTITTGIDDAVRVPFDIPFAQLLAYHLSLKLGLNPDNPSPTGTITRVVQKFETHEDFSRV